MAFYNDPEFPQGAVDNVEQHIEIHLESIRQSIEKVLMTDNAYAMLLMKLDAKNHKIDDTIVFKQG